VPQLAERPISQRRGGGQIEEVDATGLASMLAADDGAPLDSHNFLADGCAAALRLVIPGQPRPAEASRLLAYRYRRIREGYVSGQRWLTDGPQLPAGPENAACAAGLAFPQCLDLGPQSTTGSPLLGVSLPS
jgi:hypothetical protein